MLLILRLFSSQERAIDFSLSRLAIFRRSCSRRIGFSASPVGLGLSGGTFCFSSSTPLRFETLLLFRLRTFARCTVGVGFCFGLTVGRGLAFPGEARLFLAFQRNQTRVFGSLYGAAGRG